MLVVVVDLRLKGVELLDKLLPFDRGITNDDFLLAIFRS